MPVRVRGPQGVVQMSLGERAVLRIPAALGYGAADIGPIPPNAAELLTGDRMRLLIDRIHEEWGEVLTEDL